MLIKLSHGVLIPNFISPMDNKEYDAYKWLDAQELQEPGDKNLLHKILDFNDKFD